jgi:hypothetical protein
MNPIFMKTSSGNPAYDEAVHHRPSALAGFAAAAELANA